MRGRNIITWITSLSLDAPIVVLAWQNAISVHYSIDLGLHHRLLVFLAVWLGYTADRWIDAWKHKVNVSQRHSFHALRRWSLFVLWISILILSVMASLRELTSSELRNGLILTFFSIVITGIVQLIRLGRYRTIVKSAFTSLLITSSVLLFATPDSGKLLLEAFSVMSGLFFLNCILIHSWDQAIDAKQRPDDSHQSTRLTIIVAVILSLGISLSLVNTNPLSWYAISSALILITIHVYFHILHIETKRTLADMTLLTPLFVLL